MDKQNNTEDMQYEFHYSREERLSMMPDSVLEYKNRKKKNKSLLILWLDIALILLLSSGFLIYQKITGNRYSDDNYKFSMKTFVYNDNLLISITALNKKTSDSIGNSGVPVELTLKLSKSDSFYKKIYDFLPQKNSEAKIYRESIPLSEIPDIRNSSHLLVNIKFDNSSIDIRQKIVSEK